MATLYDFLYIDNDRVKSLYAQLFSGLLGAIENVASESHTKSSDGQAGGSPFGHVGHGRSTTEHESRLDRIDPHDLVLRDVLQELSDKQFIKSDIDDMQPGSFVLLNGKVSILNFETYRYFMDILPGFMESKIKDSAPNKSKAKNEKKQKAKNIKNFFQLISDIVPWSIQVIIEDKRAFAWGAINGNNLKRC